MPALKWLMVAVVLSAGCERTADLPLPAAPTPTATARLTILGPNRLEVTEQARFDVTFVDESGVTRIPTLMTWSSGDTSVLTIDRSSGAATAVKAGQSRVVVAVESVSTELFVTVVPKITLEIDDLPDEIEVGEMGDVQVVVVADFGDDEVEISLSRLASLLPGSSSTVAWSTPQPSVISVTPSVVNDTLAIVRGIAPGTATVRVAVAGLTAEAQTRVVSPPPIGIIPPTTPLPPVTPPTTPLNPFDALNGVYDVIVSGIDNDCTRGAHSQRNFTGTLTVANLNASGREGTAQLRETSIMTYSASAAIAGGGASITLTVTVDSFRYDLVLAGAGTANLAGTEVMTGPTGCRARYAWTAAKQ